MKEITVQDLKTRLSSQAPQGAAGRLVLLDVRQPEEFAASHIKGARLIPLGELPGRLGELDKNAEIVVNCKSGGRSARACELLMSHGFTDVTNLVGGNDRWQAESSNL